MKKKQVQVLEDRLKLKARFPSMITMVALGFGVSALNMALWGYWEMALIFIALSGVFDFMDGKVARRLGVESKFGEELDSLSDFVSFGVVPGFIMYQWTINAAVRINVLSGTAVRGEAIGVPWVFALFLAMCCAARLARFNSMIGQKKPSYWNHFFMGMPAPAGGIIAMFPLILWLGTGKQYDCLRSPHMVGFFLIFAAVMMASQVPTFSLKKLHLPEGWAMAVRLLVLFLIACLITRPWMTLSGVCIAYLMSIPAGVWYFLYLKKKEGKR